MEARVAERRLNVITALKRRSATPRLATRHPWVETHGYLHVLAPRDANSEGVASTSLPPVRGRLDSTPSELRNMNHLTPSVAIPRRNAGLNDGIPLGFKRHMRMTLGSYPSSLRDMNR